MTLGRFADDVSKVYGYVFTAENAILTLEELYDRPRVKLEFSRPFSPSGKFVIAGVPTARYSGS